MFQTLKTYLQTLRFVWTRKETPESVRLSHAGKSTVAPKTIDLDYKHVTTALLVTEVTEDGQEHPVALAFVKTDGTVHILDISQLSEPE